MAAKGTWVWHVQQRVAGCRSEGAYGFSYGPKFSERSRSTSIPCKLLLIGRPQQIMCNTCHFLAKIIHCLFKHFSGI